MGILVNIHLDDESATVAFGVRLAAALKGGATVFMSGTLGAGKTTATRGILEGFGHNGSVKSPTYTLVEPYELTGISVYHFDLYRLGDPEELEYMGIRDYFNSSNVCIVEWPTKGQGYLPKEDIEVIFSVVGNAREVSVVAKSSKGEEIVKSITIDY